jgi:hypothetical protein
MTALMTAPAAPIPPARPSPSHGNYQRLSHSWLLGFNGRNSGEFFFRGVRREDCDSVFRNSDGQ